MYVTHTISYVFHFISRTTCWPSGKPAAKSVKGSARIDGRERTVIERIGEQQKRERERDRRRDEEMRAERAQAANHQYMLMAMMFSGKVPTQFPMPGLGGAADSMPR